MSEERFSIAKRARSFVHAGRGIWLVFRYGHNAWLGIFCTVVTASFGLYFHITPLEWVAVVFSCGFVLVSEAFNTAMEIHMNLTSPDHHPHARDTKDVAAGAVVLAVLTTFIIGLIVFVPYFKALFS